MPLRSAAVAMVLAVDIGGTKLEVGLVDEAGVVIASKRAPTTTEEPWAALQRLVDQVVAGTTAEVLGVGVGCGGPMTQGGEAVSPLNIPAWRDFPLRRRLRELSGLPVWVDNDAKALARAEGWIGTAAGHRDFLAMVVSTGVGGGIVLDGRLLDGAAGNAGHVGHVIVEPDGADCACGGRGCLEAEASGLSIERATGRPAADADEATIARTGRLVGRGVACVANLLDLRLAVVAGSVALGMGPRFFGAAQEELDARSRISFARGARIVPAGLGSAGPLIGAGAVAWTGLGNTLS